ncbi:MAG: hypothetical protein HY318_17020, partial [Armatimonadetes bacterium]|nr:hypothetical protein [Armatimonadota bacterium]
MRSCSRGLIKDIFALISVGCLAAPTRFALAAPVSWTGGGDGQSWSDKDNWSTQQAPGFGDDVSIGGGKTVVLNGSGWYANSLNCAGLLIVNGGLTINAASSVTDLTISSTGSFTLNGNTTLGTVSLAGSLYGSGNLTLNNTFTWTGGLLSGSGLVTNTKQLLVSGSADKVFSARTIANNGTITWSGSGRLGLSYGATLQNGGTFDIQGDALMFDSTGNCSIPNTGSIKKTGGAGTTTLGVPLTNNGGTLQADSGILELQVAGTLNGGTLGAASGATLLFSRNFVVSGTLVGAVSGSVKIATTSGQLKVSPSGATLNLTGNGFEWGESALIGAQDSSNPGTLTNQGVMRMTGDSILQTKILVTTTLKNEGTILLTGNQPIVINSAGVLENRGVFDIQNAGDVTFYNPVTYTVGTIKNLGTIRKTAGSGTTTFNIDRFDNVSGVIDVQSGTIDLRPGAASFTGGNFTTANGARLQFNGTFTFTGDFTGDQQGQLSAPLGTLKMTSGSASFNFTGNGFEWSSPGALITTSDTSLQGSFTNKGNFRITGDNTEFTKTLYNTKLTNEGIIFWKGLGPVRLISGAVIDNQSGGRVDIEVDSYLSSDATGVFINRGTVRKISGNNEFAFLPYFNNLGGKLDAQIGTIEVKGGGYSTGGTTETPAVASFNADVNGKVIFTSFGYTNKGLTRLTGAGEKIIQGITLTNQTGGSLLWTDNGDFVFENSAILDNQNGAVFDIQSDAEIPFTLNMGSSALKNKGTVVKSEGPGSAIVSVSLDNTAGTLGADSGALTFSGGGTLRGGKLNAGSGAKVQFTSGTWNLSGTFTGSAVGSVELASPGVFQVDPNGVTFNVSGNSLEWTGGTITGGPVTNEGRFRISGDNVKQLSANFLNAALATTVWDGNGNLELAPDRRLGNEGTFTIETDADMVFAGGIAPRFTNVTGLVEKTKGTGATRFESVNFNSFGGAIEVRSGSLEVSQAHINDAMLNISAGASFDFKDGIASVAGMLRGSVEGALTFSGQELEVARYSESEFGYTVVPSDVTFDFFGNGFDWRGGSMTKGSLTNKGQMRLSGNADDGDRIVRGPGTLTNVGAIVWTDNGNLKVEKNTSFKNLSGTLDIQGSPTLLGAGTLENQGKVMRSSGTGTATVQLPLTNEAGAFDIQKGTLSIDVDSTFKGGRFDVQNGASLLLTKKNTFTGDFSGNVQGVLKVVGEEGTAGAGFDEIKAGTGEAVIGEGGSTFGFTGNGLTLETAALTGGGGALTNNGQMQFSNNGFGLLQIRGLTMNNQGTVSLSGSPRPVDGLIVKFFNNSLVNNKPSGTIRSQLTTTGVIFLHEPAGDESRWMNEGTLRTNTDTTVNMRFDNKGGTIVIEKGYLKLSPYTFEGGTFNVVGDTGRLYLECFSPTILSGTFSGTINGGLFLTKTTSPILDGVVLIGGAGAVFNFGGRGITWIESEIKGGTLTNQGRLEIATSNSEVLTASAPIRNSGTVEVTSFPTSGTANFAGGYTQTGGKTLLNGGNVESSSAIDIQSGVLAGKGTIKGNVTNAGELSPGESPGALRIEGDYTEKAGATMTIELGGLGPGTEFDQVNLTGRASLAGVLN